MPDVIDLSTLTPEQGFKLRGGQSRSYTGYSLTSAGDINGDGFDDLILGSPWLGTNETIDSGKVYVVFGHPGPFATIDLANDLTNLDGLGFIIEGDATADLAGFSVSSAGDVNGDGFADLLIGAPYGDYSPTSGKAYVVFGHAGAFGDIDLGNLGTAGFVLLSDEVIDWVGSSVSSAGDINHDGFADLIIGARLGNLGGSWAGEAYVVFGHAGGFGTVDLNALTPDVGFILQGGAANDRAGQGVSDAGDVNGDGFDDLIVGAPRRDDGGVDAGKAYVIFGREDGFANIDLAALTPDLGFSIQGGAAGDFAGASVSSAGDINGDGFDDLIVGAPNGDEGGADAGEAYVLFGHAGGFADIDLTALTPELGFSIQGDAADDHAGSSVSSAGDVNGDGFADLMVGVHLRDEAYVIFGHAGGFSDIDLTTLPSELGFIIQGNSPGVWTGKDVASAGDVNGDGFADLLVGAPFADNRAGEAYVVFGQAPAEAVVRDGTAIANTILGGAFDDILRGAGGDDTLEGGAGNDTLHGGSGSDTASYAHAGASVLVKLDRPGQDTHGAGVDTFISIENLSGSAFGDRLFGSSGANTLSGQAGNDLLIGGFGDDMLDGGAGNDVLRGGANHDTANYAHATAGVALRLDLETAQDTHAAGIDTLVSIENLIGSAFADTLRGSAVSNVLSGLAGDDLLRGLGGRDTLLGGDGDDLLDGGVGKDVLTGGAAADTFKFRNGEVAAVLPLADLITDFARAEGDRIHLGEIDAATAAPGDQAFAWIGNAAFSGTAGELRFAIHDGITYVKGDTDGDAIADLAIALAGAQGLQAGDFVL